MLINIKVSSSEQQIADQRKRKAKEKEAKVDWWELRKPPANEFQDYNFVDNFSAEFKVSVFVICEQVPHPNQKGDQRPDPWEIKRKYEEDLREQLQVKKKIENERKERERNEEIKLERRIQEQRERMQKEFEDEMTRRREQAEKKVQEGRNNDNDDTNEDGAADNREAENHGKVSSSTLVPHSPPVPALRDRGHKKSGNLSDSAQETEVIGNSGRLLHCYNLSCAAQLRNFKKSLDMRREELELESEQCND